MNNVIEMHMTLIISHVSLSTDVCEIDLHCYVQIQFIHFKCTVYSSPEGQLGGFCFFTVLTKLQYPVSQTVARVSLGEKQKSGRCSVLRCVHHPFYRCRCCPLRFYQHILRAVRVLVPYIYQH